MNELEPTDPLSEFHAEQLEDGPLTSDHYDTLVSGEETVVRGKAGEVVAHYIPEAFSQANRDTLFDTAVHHVEQTDFVEPHTRNHDRVYTRYHLDERRSEDGFSVHQFESVMQEMGELFENVAGERARLQERAAKEYIPSSPHSLVGGTGFSQVTVNYNTATLAHRDQIDPMYMSPMVAATEGEYDGGYFVLPEVGVAFDLGDRDFIAWGVNRVHGNTDMEPGSGGARRVSAVAYWPCPDYLEEYVAVPDYYPDRPEYL